MNTPLISVITVVYNAESTLEATIQSVLGQEESLFEYWIIDGGSTDGSVELIQKYEYHLAGWVSEPDKGIYDAMNKGIDRARGQWLYFLGADDVLLPSILTYVSSHLDNRFAIVFGNIIFDSGQLYQSFFGNRTFLQNTVHHQGAFYNKNLFETFHYDHNLRILSDYELNLKIYSQKLSALKIPATIAKCYHNGVSSSLSLSLYETNLVRSRYVKSNLKNSLLSILLRIYYYQKKIRSSLYKFIS